jgi:hypothetical protein
VKSGSGREFVVEIRREGDRYFGHLRGARASGQSSALGFDDVDCAEVARSLSLALALAVDPEAMLALPPATSAKAASPKAPNKPEPKPQPELKPKAPARSRASTASHRIFSRSARRGDGGSNRLSWDVGAVAFIQASVAPEALVGAGLSARIETTRLGLLSGRSVTLQALAAKTGLIGPEAATADYRWLVARALVAPVSVAPSTATALRPSLVADVGAVSGTGRSIAVPSTDTGLWASIGVGLQFDARLSRRLSAGLSLNVQANLSRHRFVFDRPRSVVYEIPAASLGSTLGLSWRL